MRFGVSVVMFWKWLFALYVTVWVLQGTETFTVAEALADDVDGIAGLSEGQGIGLSV